MLPPSLLCGIITLQLVTYATAATAFLVNGETQNYISSIQEKITPVLKEHSALEVASQEMLDVLSSHGQGCALLFLSPKESNETVKDESSIPSKLETLACNTKFDKLTQVLAKGEQNTQEVSRVLARLPCRLVNVVKGNKRDEKFEEANSLETQAMSLSQQLDAMNASMEQSNANYWCAEFKTTAKYKITATRQKISLKVT